MIIFIFVIQFEDVLGANSMFWIKDGTTKLGSSEPPFSPTANTDDGNIANGKPLTIVVNATDEGNFTSNGIIDTIDVLITSAQEPLGVNYTLTETGPSDGIFKGTNFVFLKDDYRFRISDTVNLVFTETEPNSDCGQDNTITQLDSRKGGTKDGYIAHSDTDLKGIGLVLTETGENTCQFVGKLKFTTTGISSEDTGTLLVSEGDILAFEKQGKSFSITNAQIIPTVNGKGSIIVFPDNPDNEFTPEVIATYSSLTAAIDVNKGSDGSTGFGAPGPKPGLVLNFIAALFGGSNGSSPPSLGLDNHQKRIVDDGFSFNGFPVDVEEFYTSYPLITTEVGKVNKIKLKIYDDRGPDNIAHVGLSYGLGSGEIFNEGKATIEYDITFDGKESISLFDPKHVLGDVNVTSNIVDCSANNNAKCLEVEVSHIFRESLEFNMVATNIWDFQRHGWQNYFNHGIEIVGKSMNPPEIYFGIYQGRIYKLLETGKNTAVDDEGNSWTFDKIWTKDYVKPTIHESDILNKKKIEAIKKLGFDYVDGQEIFGYARTDLRFSESLELQLIKAQKIMNQICENCQKVSYQEIDNIFSYEFVSRYSKLSDPKNMQIMDQENQKANEYLIKFFEKIYPGRIDD